MRSIIVTDFMSNVCLIVAVNESGATYPLRRIYVREAHTIELHSDVTRAPRRAQPLSIGKERRNYPITLTITNSLRLIKSKHFIMKLNAVPLRDLIFSHLI